MSREVEQAMAIEEIAQRYHVLPTQVLHAPVSLMRHVGLMKMIEAALPEGDE